MLRRGLVGVLRRVVRVRSRLVRVGRRVVHVGRWLVRVRSRVVRVGRWLACVRGRVGAGRPERAGVLRAGRTEGARGVRHALLRPSRRRERLRRNTRTPLTTVWHGRVAVPRRDRRTARGRSVSRRRLLEAGPRRVGVGAGGAGTHTWIARRHAGARAWAVAGHARTHAGVRARSVAGHARTHAGVARRHARTTRRHPPAVWRHAGPARVRARTARGRTRSHARTTRSHTRPARKHAGTTRTRARTTRSRT